MKTSIQFQPDIDHLAALGTQIEWRDINGAEAGTVLLMPHKDGAPVHYHPVQEEQFLVLQGTLQVYRGKEWVTLKAGESISIPKQTPHTYKNTSGEMVLFDFCITPRVRFKEMIGAMDAFVRQGKIKGSDFRSVLYLSRVMAAYPDVTQSVAPPQFMVKALAALSKLMFK
ncbi:cupin domain-containing protein [Niabella sp.]|uniref:cupin domain-containing protein n=1 Tax=Niabella sp. TaxID=1962976 RepID=UPI002633CE03|nr:cupin domain-containing protein [Niabella sp.]